MSKAKRSGKLVYVSGPIAKGDREHNFNQADVANRDLVAAGFAPLNPMFSMASKHTHDIEYAAWLEVDLAWIPFANAVLRLPGESVGADIETNYAAELGIPVFHSIAELVESFNKRDTNAGEKQDSSE